MEKGFKDEYMKIRIEDISYYIPSKIVENDVMESLINKNNQLIPKGTLNRLFGIEKRHFAESSEMVSDLAVKAATPIVQKVGKENIDFLIFSAACSDLIEPATCNIIQYKLGLSCPAIDIKNACNSFVSAITVASSLIKSKIYKNVLIVNGEKLSDAIQLAPKDIFDLKKHMAAYSLGDAGAAMLLTATKDNEASKMDYQSSYTNGNHWNLCTIKGGGSLHPHDATQNYFEGHTVELQKVIAKEGADFFHKSIRESGWNIDEIKTVFTHQVSLSTFKLVSDITTIPLGKFKQIFHLYGNTAAASIPLSMGLAKEAGELERGDKIAIIGLAAGISLSLQLLTY